MPTRRDEPGEDPEDVDREWNQIVAHLTGAPDPRAWQAEEEEERFVPPEPGPVLGGNPLLTLAWGAVVGVPLLLLVAVVVWPDIPTVVLQVAGALFLIGLAVLLWRMPRTREDQDGPGAVV